MRNYTMKPLMSRNLMSRKWTLLLVIVLFLSGQSRAETTGNPESGIDALELKLEMKRHEQLAAQKSHPESVLAEFMTDGCSGGLSVGWQYLAGKIEKFHTAHGTRPAWESCCVVHDRAYHTGGTHRATPAESFHSRKEADLALENCVLNTGMKRASKLSAQYNISPLEVETIYTAIAALMYRSVRIGGMPCTGLPWRWGYGWPECE